MAVCAFRGNFLLSRLTYLSSNALKWRPSTQLSRSLCSSAVLRGTLTVIYPSSNSLTSLLMFWPSPFTFSSYSLYRAPLHPVARMDPSTGRSRNGGHHRPCPRAARWHCVCRPASRRRFRHPRRYWWTLAMVAIKKYNPLNLVEKLDSLHDLTNLK